MERLVGCRGCSRHVRAHESACPFCSAPLVTAARARRVTALLGSALVVGGCASTQGPDSDGADGAAPVAGDAGAVRDAAQVGDEETYSSVPVYGASGCDLAPPGTATSPLLGGAVVAAAAVAMLRRRRSP